MKQEQLDEWLSHPITQMWGQKVADEIKELDSLESLMQEGRTIEQVGLEATKQAGIVKGLYIALDLESMFSDELDSEVVE